MAPPSTQPVEPSPGIAQAEAGGLAPRALRAARDPAMPLFAATIFLSAFLLFQVQPLIGRVVLPWFGGTPAVWTTCMLFFQVLLLAGYGYSHLLASQPLRWQVRIHAALLAVSLLALGAATLAWGSPMLPGPGWKPPDSGLPTLRVLGVLAVSVGLPYFVVSTTGPLLQAWFSRAHAGRRVYRLYALSNLGSLLALVSYPFVFEPMLALANQAWLWAGLFVLFAAGALACAPRSGDEGLPPAPVAPAPLASEARPGPARFALWTLLAACASMMLLAVTNQLCQEVAVVPFLWVLPLALYLLSFVLTFEGGRWYTRPRFAALLALATLLALAALHLGARANLLFQVFAWLALLFAAATLCHGELARLKPSPRHLTGFYLALALGGALGGTLVGLVAPRVFKGFWELHLGLWLTWGLLLVVLADDRSSVLWGRRARPARLGFAVGLLGLLVFLMFDLQQPLESTHRVSRNFYGRLAVAEAGVAGEAGHRFEMKHGIVTHGVQFREPSRRAVPTAYYGPRSGVGLAMRLHPKRFGEGDRRLRVGVVGLGVGTLATYGEPGDLLRFYEINPEVIGLARGEGGFFSYLSDSRAEIEVVEGDARVSLERELKAGTRGDYDLLVLDAFSSDAIPVHLLTREAFGLYLERLAAGGVIAVHISNLFLDLRPVVSRLAAAVGLRAAAVVSDPLPEESGDEQFSAEWVLLSAGPEFLERAEFAGAALAPSEGRAWTDDFSNLFEAVILTRNLVVH